MIRTLIISGIVVLALTPVAAAGNGVNVRWFSQQYTQSRAGAGARIDIHRSVAGRPARVSQLTGRVTVDGSLTELHVKVTGGAATKSSPGPQFRSLPAGSPIFKKTQPAGPGSFWYPDGGGHACMYSPNSVLPCFTVIGNRKGGPPVTPPPPIAIAAHVADRMGLSPGKLKASPSNAGMTGAASWFWLDPAPTTQQLSLTLAGEAVTVTAIPVVRWSFGDGATHDGGAGVPYRPGATPEAAVTHVYDTRCLAGDLRRDPYVLASCGSDGYQLVAAVTWQISYRATGSVAAAGTLPTRTTTSFTTYPVSEARAFLVPGATG
jgi:hypothetical protein